MFYLDTRSIPREGITKTPPVQLRDPVPLRVMDTLSYTPRCAESSRRPDRSPRAFIVVEGGDGAGKTTQLSLLNEALQRPRIPCHHHPRTWLERHENGLLSPLREVTVGRWTG